MVSVVLVVSGVILARVRHFRRPENNTAANAPNLQPYSAPRRFDLVAVFVVMAAFSLLLGGMGLLELPPVASLVIAGFVMLVGIGQALLFGGRKPRLAAVLVGTACYAITMFGMSMLDAPNHSPGLLPVMLVQGVIWGPLFGYIAGGLVGGTFLVAALLRKAFHHLGAVENDNRSELDA